jgi:hypothetical protein
VVYASSSGRGDRCWRNPWFDGEIDTATGEPTVPSDMTFETIIDGLQQGYNSVCGQLMKQS